MYIIIYREKCARTMAGYLDKYEQPVCQLPSRLFLWAPKYDPHCVVHHGSCLLIDYLQDDRAKNVLLCVRQEEQDHLRDQAADSPQPLAMPLARSVQIRMDPAFVTREASPPLLLPGATVESDLVSPQEINENKQQNKTNESRLCKPLWRLDDF